MIHKVIGLHWAHLDDESRDWLYVRSKDEKTGVLASLNGFLTPIRAGREVGLDGDTVTHLLQDDEAPPALKRVYAYIKRHSPETFWALFDDDSEMVDGLRKFGWGGYDDEAEEEDTDAGKDDNN